MNNTTLTHTSQTNFALNFPPTWLYIKQHNVTGLKYFGKTAAKKPETYKGSGVYWRRHLAAHGNDVTTVWSKLFSNFQELSEYATKFSADNNIVESKDWANLVVETGLDGGAYKGMGKGKSKSESHRKKISESQRKRPVTNKQLEMLRQCRESRIYKPMTEITKNKLRETMVGRKTSENTKELLKARKQDYLKRTQRLFEITTPDNFKFQMLRIPLEEYCRSHNLTYGSLVAKGRQRLTYKGYLATEVSFG
jgi:hypothetical protein